MPVLTEIVARLDVWHQSALNYQAVGIGLLIVAIISSAVITVFTEQLDKKYLRIAGLLAAIATTSIATFDPMEVGQRFRAAWTVLDNAVFRHKADPTKYPIETVVDAAQQGQAHINEAPLIKGSDSPTK